MTPDDANAAGAAPTPTPTPRLPRLNPKLLIVGGAATLVLSLLGGGAVCMLWPDAPGPVQGQAEGKAGGVAQRPRHPGVTAAGGDRAVPCGKAASASASASAASTPLLVHDDGDAPAVAPVAEVRTEARSESPQVHVATVEAEPPMDRLQRRLAQVLGAKAEIDGAHPGEWRLVTRAGSVASVAHALPARPVPAERSAGHPEHGAPWGYEGRGGPQAWGRLKPEFGTCAKGQRQSPIDIHDGLALDLEPVLFDYRPSHFGVIDTGRTVQVNLAPGNFIDVNGRRFELQQFHFHRPSEERINGRQFDMNAHLVHRDADGKLAVVAVLLERGAAQPLLQAVWSNLPLEKGEELRARSQIDLNGLLPSDRRYFTYMGSLTTPPCSEGVLWVVLQQPVQVSGRQIDIFSRLYPMNARPIQQASGRLIKQSN